MTVKETLAELVNIDSVSSRSNTDIIQYLEKRCEALNLKTKRFAYRDELGIEKINLVALAGTEFSPDTNIELALVGHTDTVPYDPNWTEATTLTERDGKLYGRGSCDTKGFIAAALTAVETLDLSRLNKPLALILTADEEIGLRGAKVAAQYFDPALAITIDSTPANDLPDHDGNENISYNTKLGLGPAIYIADGSTLHDPRLVRFLQAVATAERIPHQLRQPGGGGTDSAAIQRALSGIPTVSISVPHRYTHSPVSLSRVDDWKHTLNLLHIALRKIKPDLIKVP